jgi:hypothetical protein
MDELQPLLFELVCAGNVEEIQRALPHCNALLENPTTGSAVRAELIKTAASQGSLAVVQTLLWEGERPISDDTTLQIIQGAIKSHEMELVKWILTKPKEWEMAPSCYRQVISAVIRSDSPEIFKAWEESLGEVMCGTSGTEYVIPGIEFVTSVVLNAAKKFPMQELRLMEVWRRLAREGKLNMMTLGSGLTSVAKSSLSITQAKVLLELGVFVDFPHERGSWRTSTKSMTALHFATKKNSAKAAEFVKFLLLEGASPEVGCRRRWPAMEPGAIGIHQWLGMTWDELVEWTKGRVGRGADDDASVVRERHLLGEDEEAVETDGY